ncbi:MAG: hypothetical protein MJ204_02790 [Bacteroidales bacterium]|nr:hypothetical protein [Bacteroidales bacterium]MCQ2605455.1 hypothetical protein [Bacteroidales bacterium]
MKKIKFEKIRVFAIGAAVGFILGILHFIYYDIEGICVNPIGVMFQDAVRTAFGAFILSYFVEY